MNIVIFGTGGHAKVVADIVEKEGIHRIVGLVSQDGRPGNFIPGYEVIAGNSGFHKVIKKVRARGAIVALGNAAQRMELVKRIGGKLEFVTAIHPAAVIDKSVRIGAGTVVMAGVVINSSTVTGRHCILNTSCSVDHDCRIGDYTHICPGCHIAGYVNIGRECWIGIGSTIIDHLSVGDQAFVGAGSVVAKAVGRNMRVCGNPARKFKSSGDKKRD